MLFLVLCIFGDVNGVELCLIELALCALKILNVGAEHKKELIVRRSRKYRSACGADPQKVLPLSRVDFSFYMFSFVISSFVFRML